MVHIHHQHTEAHANNTTGESSERDLRNRQRLGWAMLLTGGFMLAEVVGGIISGSLALLADAAHMFTDSVALALAWFAFRLTQRPADAARTFGYHRFPILAAFTNGISLLFIVGWIFYEAIERFRNPGEVLGGTMLAIALLGLAVNLIAFYLLHGAGRGNLNIRGAMLHVLGDFYGSVAAIVAAVVILWTGWMPIDPLLSALVGLLVLRSAWMLIKESAHVLLEGAPTQLHVPDIGPDLVHNIAAVKAIHHVHAWSLSEEKPLVTLHARLHDNYSDLDSVIKNIKQRLVEQFGVAHATVEIEFNNGTDHSVQPNRQNG